MLPAHLPREEEVIKPEGWVEGAKQLGQEVTELLEYIPGRLYVRRIVRPKYLINSTIILAPLPTLPIPKGNAGAGFLAYLLVSKWVDHLPFYRLVQILKRDGVEISRATINDWFKAACVLLEPLYELLVDNVRAQTYLQADESPIKVLDSDHKGSTHRGYHWVYHAPLIKMAVFDYRPSRSREGPARFLENFQGALQTDGYTAYNELGRVKGLTLLACMAHARRYFDKSLDSDKPRATHALDLIQKLYAVEKHAKEMTPEQRKAIRQIKAMPILEQLKQWMDVQQPKVLPKSPIGKAISYTLTLWPRLVRYTQDGNWNIDNNPIENLIRPLALGRKNYMFAGSHEAAQRAAMMYSFFATCKMNDVNPSKWLKDVLQRIPDAKINNLEDLLPSNWKQKDA